MASFPSPTMIETNGIDMAVYEAGPKNGIAIVLLHGFADLAYTWRHQLPVLAQAGYRALAPDLRGCGLSGRPAAVQAYDMDHLTADMTGLLDAFAVDRAVFCGHDWGGVVAWNMAIAYSRRVRGVIGVNTPFFPRPPVNPLSYLRATYGNDMYIVQLQEPDTSDAMLAKDIGRSIRFFMRKNTLTRAEFETAPPEIRGLNFYAAFGRDESNWRGEQMLAPDEMKFYVEAYKRTGFTGAINWYRNLSRNWESSAGADLRVKVPGLMIMAEDDFILPPDMAEGMEEYVPDLEKALVRGCGHWTQQEYPYRTNAIMVDWLKRRFI